MLAVLEISHMCMSNHAKQCLTLLESVLHGPLLLDHTWWNCGSKIYADHHETVTVELFLHAKDCTVLQTVESNLLYCIIDKALNALS